MTSDDLGLPQPPAQAVEGDVRVPAPFRPVIRLRGIDEYGPMLDWYRPWTDFPIGTKFVVAEAEDAALSAEGSATIAAAQKQAAEEMRERAAAPDGWQLVPIEPTEAMWGELARQIVMWSSFTSPTGRALHDHLRHSGYARPDWLLALIPYVDHVPPKGDVAVAIYRAMLAAAPPFPSSSPEDQQKAAATPTIADPDGEARS